MIMLTTVITGLTLFTVVLNGTTEEPEEIVEEPKTHEFSTPELPAKLTGENFPTDLDTPLTYIETRQLMIDMKEDHLAEAKEERQRILDAHREAMALILAEKEAERIAQEKAEEERIAREKAEQKRIEEEKAEAAYIVRMEELEKEQNVTVTSTKQESQPEEKTESKEEPVEKKEVKEEKPKPSKHVSSHLLAQLVNSEARGESYEGKVAVAEVVLNRVHSDRFPNSIEGVVYQKGQFQVVSNGSINNQPTDEAVRASNQALGGSNYTKGALFFYNPRTATDRWQDSLRTTVVIGNHTFKNY